MKKTLIIVVVLIAILAVAMTGCKGAEYDEFTLNGWEYIALNRLGKNPEDVDISKLRVEDFISLDGISTDTYLYKEGEKNANNEGWYATLIDNFDVTYEENSGLNPEIWTTSRHDIRWESNKKNHPEYANYWCSEMVSVVDGNVIVKAEYDDNHTCEVCKSIGNTKGRFTGGFETRNEVFNGKVDSNNKRQYDSNIIWAQAFGYYETRVKFPNVDGMWSAFWLQGNEMREIGFDGIDGTEIDVFESAFRYNNDEVSRMGHALLWNGYGQSARVEGSILRLQQNLYDGNYHTFSLLWTPDCYIFFIDNIATWATDAGGVSRVPEFLRFTCEIDAGDEFGPHGQKIGAFPHDVTGEFVVDYIRVYQNENYEKFIAPSIDGKPYSQANNFESAFKSNYDKAN